MTGIVLQPRQYGYHLKSKKTVAEWLTDAIEGKMSDYGVELIDKKYD